MPAEAEGSRTLSLVPARGAHLLRGSRGPSTVILMARWYVATCGGFVKTVIVSVKLFPVDRREE